MEIRCGEKAPTADDAERRRRRRGEKAATTRRRAQGRGGKRVGTTQREKAPTMRREGGGRRERARRTEREGGDDRERGPSDDNVDVDDERKMGVEVKKNGTTLGEIPESCGKKHPKRDGILQKKTFGRTGISLGVAAEHSRRFYVACESREKSASHPIASANADAWEREANKAKEKL